MATLKELATAQAEKFVGGHTSCAGCGYPNIFRLTLAAVKDPVVVVGATGCCEVNTSIFPYTSWKVPFLHNAFENSAAACSGVEAAYYSMVKSGKLAANNTRFIAFGGDGGTYDIGLQSLSGAMERGHDMLYICYDNGAYMNTGIQRSGATPRYANTTTAPVGKVVPGKMQKKKDLAKIMVGHNVPYVAQTIAGNWKDLTNKIEKAMAIRGPKFIVVLATCPLGWQTKTQDTVRLTQLAVDSCFWPLYEVENGKYKLNDNPEAKGKKIPAADWLKLQGRFKHLFKPGGEKLLAEIQAEIDKDWNDLKALCEFHSKQA
jgi:pyruvate ferredoxin oxidoreductase beta subunit